VWSAHASVFSGKPDPTWGVEDHVGEELERLWYSLPATDMTMPAAPPLGYRGCALLSTDRMWLAHRGVVELIVDTQHERRGDPARRFEQAVLASAPPGTIPPWVIAEVSANHVDSQ